MIIEEPLKMDRMDVKKCLSKIKCVLGSKNDYSDPNIRLKSYVYAPLHFYRLKHILTEKGFHYTGNEIKCFLCSAVVQMDKEPKITIDNVNDLDGKHHRKCKLFSNLNKTSLQNKCSKDSVISTENSANNFDETDGYESNDSSNDIYYEIQQIDSENERLRKTYLCRRCEKKEIQTLFLPCRHFICCESCAESLNHCLHCFEKILGTVRVYQY